VQSLVRELGSQNLYIQLACGISSDRPPFKLAVIL
jgi:hypothetical protein